MTQTAQSIFFTRKKLKKLPNGFRDAFSESRQLLAKLLLVPKEWGGGLALIWLLNLENLNVRKQKSQMVILIATLKPHQGRFS